MNKKDYYYLLILLVSLSTLVIVLEIGEPCYFLYDDNANYFLPSYIHNWRSIAENGKIPLLNFHQYLGQTHLAQGQTAVLYLPVYIGAYLSLLIFKNQFYTIDIIVFLHLSASVVFMYMFLRKSGIIPSLSILCSLIWVSFPFIIFTPKSWVFVSFAAAFIPLNFLFLVSFIENISLRNALSLSVIKAAFFFQGYIQYFYVLYILEFLFFSIMLIRRKNILNSFLLYFSSVAFTTILVMPLLLPMIEAKSLADWRGILPREHLYVWRILLSDLINAQLFRFRENALDMAGSQIYFFGPLVLLIFCALTDKKTFNEVKKNRMALTSIVILLLAITLCSKYYALFCRIIPGLGMFRYQAKLFIFFLFFLVTAIAIISDTYIRTNKEKSLLIYFIIAASLIMNTVIDISAGKNIVFSKYRIDSPGENYLSVFRKNGYQRIFTFWLEDFPPKDAARYMSFNSATMFGLFHFGGYNNFISAINNRYSLNLTYLNNYSENLNNELLTYLSYWGVRYFITDNSSQHIERIRKFNQLKKIYQDRETLIFENTKALPIVFYKDNKKRIPFEIGTNEIIIYPEKSEAGEIIAGIAPINGYKVFIDGKPSASIMPDVVPVKATIPGGTKKVKIKYSSSMFEYGVTIFLFFWILYIILYLKGILKTIDVYIKKI